MEGFLVCYCYFASSTEQHYYQRPRSPPKHVAPGHSRLRDKLPPQNPTATPNKECLAPAGGMEQGKGKRGEGKGRRGVCVCSWLVERGGFSHHSASSTSIRHSQCERLTTCGKPGHKRERKERARRRRGNGKIQSVGCRPSAITLTFLFISRKPCKTDKLIGPGRIFLK